MTGEVALVDADVMVGPLPTLDTATGTVAELLEDMDRLGIAGAVVGHTWGWLHDPAAGNRQLNTTLAGQERLWPCWVMLPDTCAEVDSPDVFMRRAVGSGVAAVRVFPAEHRYDLAGADGWRMLAAAAAAGVPVLVDAEQTTWAAVEAVARRLSALTIIVCKVGYAGLRQAAGVLARTENVLLATSNLSSHCGLEWLVERFGAGRLVFGGGAPVFDPASPTTRLLWSELDDGAVAAIGATNLLSVLRMPEAGR